MSETEQAELDRLVREHLGANYDSSKHGPPYICATCIRIDDLRAARARALKASR